MRLSCMTVYFDNYSLIDYLAMIFYFLVRKFKSKKKADSEEDETIDVLDDSLM